MIKSYYFNQYGLVKFTVIVCGLVAASIIGVFGLGGWGLAPLLTELRKANSPSVLAAAPFNTTRIGVEMCALTKLYAPPEYSKVTLSKTQSIQFSPSSCCVIFLKDPRDKTPSDIGGTTGIAFSNTIALAADTGGANIDVWMPNKNITRTPDINDQNAIVILDINPPINNESSESLNMRFHYGQPPPFPKEMNQPDNLRESL
jgi:hypothetical protein